MGGRRKKEENPKRDKVFCGVDAFKIQQARPVFDLQYLKLFLYFVKERYSIHIRKDLLHDKEYTSDKVLQKYHFTNVKREHDYTTHYLVEHITDNAFLTTRNKILNCIAFRFFNNEFLFELVGMPFNFDMRFSVNRISEIVRAFSAKIPNFNYFSDVLSIDWKLINEDVIQDKNYYEKYKDLPAALVLKYIEQIQRTWTKKYGKGKERKDYPSLNLVPRILEADNQLDVFHILKSLDGVSDYLAYQIFLDLTYIKDFPFTENDFVRTCQDSRNAIALVFQNKDNMTYEECLFWIQSHWGQINQMVDSKFRINTHSLMFDLKTADRTMKLADLEGCFREFYRYLKGGTRIYKPHNYCAICL